MTRNDTLPTQKSSYFRNVSFMLFLYWAILVCWQNVGGAEARSTMDLVVKVGVLIYFVTFYLLHAKRLYSKAAAVALLALCLTISFFGEADRSVGVLIAYVYPILVLMMVYGFGDKLEINRKQLVAFCNSVILVVLYAVGYALVFCTDQFRNAFSIDNAYGNELSSFFISNHEYGIYLVFAMAACIICLKYKSKKRVLERLPYFVAFLLFFVNVILTFSRTAIFAAVLLFFVCGMFLSRKTRWRILVLVVVLLVVVASVPMLRDFVFNIVLKENNLAGRDELSALALHYFDESTLLEQFFGHGISESRIFFEEATSHGSVHNGYLQVLVYYGLVGLAFLLVFLGAQFVVCIREIKRDRFMGAMSLGFLVAATAMMLTNTTILFNSSIDSWFLTMVAILVPKYVRNAIYAGRFGERDE